MIRSGSRLFPLVAVLLLWNAPAGAQLKELLEWGRGAGAESQPVKRIAHFKISGPLVETPVNLPPLFGDAPPQSMMGLLERFKQARHDESVVAVVLDVQEAALGLAQIHELHRAMRKFRAVEKAVFVHADMLTTTTYALATGASHISLVPTGDLWLMGLYGETPYLRGTLDKLDIEADIEQCGSHKTAGEPLMRSGPSEASKEMTAWLLDSLYEELVGMIATGRDLTPERVRKLIDDGPYSAERALEAGLIDSVQHRQDFLEELSNRYGSSVNIVTNYGKRTGEELPQDFFAMFQFLMELLNPTTKQHTEPSVAVVFVEGMIQLGSGRISPFGGASGAFSATIRKALDEAVEDPSVKAVVLRVDSPGGSALASEIIWNATQRVAKRKPFVVSMGNVAGSGGYYVSCGAHTIFADDTTITASLGVLGGKLVTTGAWQKMGVNWYTVQRGEMAGMLSSARRFNDTERARIRRYMESAYDTFLRHVTDGRGDKLTKPIEEIAGGRVFTGAQALALGLVDKIGGLEDAVQHAADAAGVADFEIRVIPEPPTIFDLFRPEGMDDEYALAPHHPWEGSAEVSSALAAARALDPRRAEALLRLLKQADLLRGENVLAVMPLEWVIR